MKLMPCPLNGLRNISEFICFGAVTEMPEPSVCSDREWTEFNWFSDNTVGVVREWWCHVPTSYWFIAERNTLTDEIQRTYPASQIFRSRRDFKTPAPEGG